MDDGSMSDKEKQWWRGQRSRGAAQRLAQQAGQEGLIKLWRGTATKSGLRRPRRVLRQALPGEYIK